MYSMVMMMALSGTPDSAAFGGKLFGNRSGCHGTTVASCYGSSCHGNGCGGYTVQTVPAPSYGCTGTYYASGYGCSGSNGFYGSTSCHGTPKSGFLGLRECFQRKSSSCHGCTGYTTSSYAGCTGYVHSHAGCTGHTAAYTGCTGYTHTHSAACCPAPVVTTGCTGGVISGYSAMPATTPGTVITETPSTTAPAVPAGELKDMPKPDAKDKAKSDKKGDGV